MILVYKNHMQIREECFLKKLRFYIKKEKVEFKYIIIKKTKSDISLVCTNVLLDILRNCWHNHFRFPTS